MAIKDNLQALKELCAEHKDVIGSMVKLLKEINATVPHDPIGICQCPERRPFPATQADCDSLIVCEWTPIGHPHLDELCRRLDRLCDNNMQMINEALSLLKDVKGEHPEQPLGICLRKNGECFPGTQGDVAEPGGIWSYFLPPPRVARPSKTATKLKSTKPKKPVKRPKPTKKLAKAKKRAHR